MLVDNTGTWMSYYLIEENFIRQSGNRELTGSLKTPQKTPKLRNMGLPANKWIDFATYKQLHHFVSDQATFK